jgi:hypothetical protein
MTRRMHQKWGLAVPRTWLVIYASSLTLGGGLLAPIGAPD